MNKIFTLFLFLVLSLNVFSQSRFVQRGEASFYADKFHGRKTSNGEIFSQNKLTAAHRTLPFGSVLRVTNLSNGISIKVRVNDRGPFARARILDLSKLGAQQLGFIRQGHVRVKIELLGTDESINNTKDANNHKPVINATVEKHNVISSHQNVYGVQVASYRDLDNAINFLLKAKRKTSLPVYIKSVNIRRKKYYKLVVGKYRTYNKARKIKRRLRRKFRSCFVLSY